MSEDSGIRAGQAKRELALTESAFDAMRDDMMKAIINSRPDETEVREVAYYQIRAIDAVRQKLRSIIETAAMDEAIAAKR